MSSSSSVHEPAAAPPTPGSSRSATPLGQGVRWLLRACGVVLAAGGSLLLLAWLTLYWGILPHLSVWRTNLERALGPVLGGTLRIGRIEAETGHGLPVLTLRDVALEGPDGQPVLQVAQVQAALSWRSLWHRMPVFRQLQAQGVVVLARRDAQGRVWLGPWLLPTSPSPSPEAQAPPLWLRWGLAQGEVSLRDGQLRLVDEAAPAALPVQFEGVNLWWRNRLSQHHISLDWRWPQGWGDAVALRGRFTQAPLSRPSPWPHWTGTLYADVPWLDSSAALPRLAPWLPPAWAQALAEVEPAWDGAARAWLGWEQGRWQQLTLDVAVPRLQARLQPKAPAVALRRLQGRLQWERTPEAGWRLNAHHLGWDGPSGATQAPTELRLAWQPAASAPQAATALHPAQGQLSATRLDLAAWAQLAQALPLPASARATVASLAPQGQVLGLTVAGQAQPGGAGLRYRYAAQLQGLALAPGPAPGGHLGRPGVRGLNAQIQGHERGGQARLTLEAGQLALPGVFAEPLVPLEHLTAQLNWQLSPATARTPWAVQVDVNEARFANADAQGQLNARWRTGTPGREPYLPGVLQLQGRLSQAQAPRVARYLPLELPADVRRYVADAVRTGHLQGVDFRVKGDLNAFPFAPGTPGAAGGEFRINGQWHDGTFAYVPGDSGAADPWPALTEVEAELVFDRTALHIQRASAKVGALQLAPVSVDIADLAHAPVLEVQGVATGPLLEGLRFVEASPVGVWTSHVLREVALDGPGTLHLALQVPLTDLAHSHVQGTVTLGDSRHGLDVRWRPAWPWVRQARGQVRFDERSFSAQAQGLALGGALRLRLAQQPEAPLVVDVDGQAQVAELPAVLPEPARWAPLARLVSGSLPYAVRVTVADGAWQLRADSSLQGLALALPEPLNKPAEAAWPLHLTRQTPAPGQEEWAVTLGDRLAAQARRTPDTATWEHLRLAWARPPSVAASAPARAGSGAKPASPEAAPPVVGPPPALPAAASGELAARVALDGLDLAAWRELLRSWPTPPEDELAAGTLAGPPAPARSAGGPSLLPLGLRPAVQLQLQHLRWGERSLLEGLDVRWHTDTRPGPTAPVATAFQLQVDSSDTRGHLSLALDEQGRAQAVQADLAALGWQGRPLGRLALRATTEPSPQAEPVAPTEPAAPAPSAPEPLPPPAWQLQHFILRHEDGQLTALGRYQPGDTPHTQLTLDAQLTDAGHALDRLGLGRVLKGGQAWAQADLHWHAAPWSPQPGLLNGQARLRLEGGQVLQIDPGVGRVLGVLNLQTLPRRLWLDFRDVFGAGLALDTLGGDFTLTQGVARTDNLRLQGVQAAVLMGGNADLGLQTLDLDVLVVPQLSADTASLAYAAVNPAVGLGTFLAQRLLRPQLLQAGAREFHLGGTWEAPVVEAVERSILTPLPGALGGTP